MGKRWILRAAVFAVCLASGISWAQVNTGTILGTIRDSSGEVLPGVKVTVENTDTGISRIVTTDDGGRYSAPSVNIGNYRVTGSLTGFQTLVRTGIVLTVGQDAVVDLSLTVGSVNQTVEVTGEAPVVETTSASLGSLVDNTTIRALPLNGRSYDQLALLQPGVILMSPGQSSGTTFPQGSGKRFSVGGQRSQANSFLLDGTNISDQGNGTGGGAAGTNLGVDTILEFKIFTNSYKAEYGKTEGSVISAITRSGTNTVHGTAFEYIRNSALDARNFFDVGSAPPPFKRNQFGGVLGGPIKRDKMFIFGGYEGLRQGLGTTLIATVPTLLARQGILPTGTVPVNPASVPFLNLYPTPNGRDFGDGSAEYLSSPTVVTNEDYFMVRLDYQLNSKTSIFGRYTFDTDSVNAPQSLPPLVVTSASRRQYTTLQANTVLGPKALNNVRFAFNRTHDAANQLLIPDPGLSIVPGRPLGAVQVGAIIATSRAITPLGTSQGNGIQTWAFSVFEWGDDFTYVTGKHSFKTGVDIQRIRDNYAKGTSVNGAYTFNTFNDFLAGTPANLTASSPLGVDQNVGLRQSLFGVYFQDDYTVNSRLTLNLGLRWEMTTDPTEAQGKSSILPSLSAANTVVSDAFFSVTKKNFEPRFGLAWRLNASGKAVLRAGAGIYHNQVLPWLYANHGVFNPPFGAVFSVSNPPFPNGTPALQASGLSQLDIRAPFQKTPVNDQYNLSIQQEIFKDTVVQVAYAGNRGNHLETQIEADTPIPTIVNGQPFFPAGATRRNPAFAGVRYYQTNGNSIYNSVTAAIRRQAASGIQGQIFYTFAKATDDSNPNSDSQRSPQSLLDPEDRGRDWALSDMDVRHAVGINISYPIPFRVSSRAFGTVLNDWTLDGIGTFTSGEPFTARLSKAVSRNLASSLAERPNLIAGANKNPTSGTSAGCAGFPAGTTLGGADHFYDPCSFSLPAAGTYGSLGRNTIIGPGLADVDLALEKVFKLHEALNATFRAEVFNVMNHANFGLPNTTALAAGGAANSSAGRISYTVTTSRQLQFALRISF